MDHEGQEEGEEAGGETLHGRIKQLFRTRVGSRKEEQWSSKREKEMKKKKDDQNIPEHLRGAFADAAEQTLIDFGTVDESDKRKSKRMAITVCGRRVFNYPSEQAVSRGGWLQFSILARDSRLETAIELCRNWEEFWELNIVITLETLNGPDADCFSSLISITFRPVTDYCGEAFGKDRNSYYS